MSELGKPSHALASHGCSLFKKDEEEEGFVILNQSRLQAGSYTTIWRLMKGSRLWLLLTVMPLSLPFLHQSQMYTHMQYFSLLHHHSLEVLWHMWPIPFVIHVGGNLIGEHVFLSSLWLRANKHGIRAEGSFPSLWRQRSRHRPMTRNKYADVESGAWSILGVLGASVLYMTTETLTASSQINPTELQGWVKKIGC